MSPESKSPETTHTNASLMEMLFDLMPSGLILYDPAAGHLKVNVKAQQILQMEALNGQRDALEEAVPALVEQYPGLEVHGIVADFEHHLEQLPDEGPRLVAFLGGTIGNFEPTSRAAFLVSGGTGSGWPWLATSRGIWAGS